MRLPPIFSYPIHISFLYYYSLYLLFSHLSTRLADCHERNIGHLPVQSRVGFLAYSEMNLMLTFFNLVLLYVEKCTTPFVLNYRDLKALKKEK